MLKPKPSPPKVTPREATPRDAARALLSMLGEGAPSSAVPDDQMRSLARDLVAQVEGRRQAPTDEPVKTVAAPTPVPAIKTKRRQLFSRSAPLAASASPPQVQPSPRDAAVTPSPMEATARPASPAREPVLPISLDAPTPSRARHSILYTPDQVHRLVGQAGQPSAREHPAILALNLRGRPALEQAQALRALPRGQARSVHRALRMVEAAPMPG